MNRNHNSGDDIDGISGWLNADLMLALFLAILAALAPFLVLNLSADDLQSFQTSAGLINAARQTQEASRVSLVATAQHLVDAQATQQVDRANLVLTSVALNPTETPVPEGVAGGEGGATLIPTRTPAPRSLSTIHEEFIITVGQLDITGSDEQKNAFRNRVLSSLGPAYSADGEGKAIGMVLVFGGTVSTADDGMQMKDTNAGTRTANRTGRLLRDVLPKLFTEQTTTFEYFHDLSLPLNSVKLWVYAYTGGD